MNQWKKKTSDEKTLKMSVLNKEPFWNAKNEYLPALCYTVLQTLIKYSLHSSCYFDCTFVW